MYVRNMPADECLVVLKTKLFLLSFTSFAFTNDINLLLDLEQGETSVFEKDFVCLLTLKLTITEVSLFKNVNMC